MPAIDRRRFLQLTGGATAASMLLPSIARAASVAPRRRTGTIRDVEHIVVLMQENRAFDHYFGTLRGVRGFGDPNPVRLPNGQPVWNQAGSDGTVPPFHPTAANLGLAFLQDLDHSWDGTHDAFNHGNYDQWVPSKTSTTMAYLTRHDIPFHYALADAFTICDGYHCSLLGPTDPNRYYMWTGYVGNDGAGGGPVIDNAEAGYGWGTYPERLQQAGVSWKLYQDVGTGLDAADSWGWTDDAYIGNYGDSSLLYFHQYQNATPGSPLYQGARTGTDASAGQSFFDLLKQDVTSGALPDISWVVAPEAFTEHPNWPANYGAWYVSQVLDALTSDPDVWASTVLLLTYDENDGFFDHVVPPYPSSTVEAGQSQVSTTDELYTGDNGQPGPYGLGVRVPMLALSPWSRGGWVNSEVFDHTSIIRFMEARFGVAEPNISPWRRAVAGDLTSVFDFSGASTAVPRLPSTAAYVPPDSDRHPDYVPSPPAQGQLPNQEPGTRPARALPYRLNVRGHVVRDGLALNLASSSARGVQFQVRAVDGTGPWSYTVAPRSTLAVTVPLADSRYDLTLVGPNGYLRRFAGNGAGVEVTQKAGTSSVVELVLSNSGGDTVLTLANAYRKGTGKRIRLTRNARATITVATGDDHGWYDVTLTSSADPTFVRQLAGHVENGQPSTSDPRLGD